MELTCQHFAPGLVSAALLLASITRLSLRFPSRSPAAAQMGRLER